MKSPRYLQPFEATALAQLFADVVVVGSGIAGNFAALAAAQAGARVVLLTKEDRLESNTRWAQAGVAAALDASDSVEAHLADTISAGDGLCHADVVRGTVAEAPRAVARLEAFGVNFDRDGVAGPLLLGREGGHSARRVVHADGDATGLHVQRALGVAVAAERRIRVVESAFAVDVLTDDGEAVGVLFAVGAELRVVWSGAVILATGGAARLFRESTNPAVTTGDGIAMAYRAGAAVRDMEFMQFHPTVLYVPGAPRKLLSEAARGEGAVVLDQRGQRFLSAYDPRGELAPRDVVSRAMVDHMARNGDDHVLLDLRGVPADRLRSRLPGVVSSGRAVGIDVTREPLPIRPAAHYTIGGVLCDLDGRTTVPSLFVAGEVSSSGLHGANRLASNSLLEGVVAGDRAGHAAAERAKKHGTTRARELTSSGPGAETREVDVADLVRSVASLVWRRAGVRRSGPELTEAGTDLRRWSRLALGVTMPTREGMVAQNLCILAGLVVEAAALRHETRGVHWRSDYPVKDDGKFRAHILQGASSATTLTAWSDAAETVSW